MITRENSTNFKIGLNQFRVYLQKFQIKIKKRKGKDQTNIEKAAGQHSGPNREKAHGPPGTPTESVLSVFWIPGYPGPPAPGPLQRPSFGPGMKR
jgi:hypothetical protein